MVRFAAFIKVKVSLLPLLNCWGASRMNWAERHIESKAHLCHTEKCAYVGSQLSDKLILPLICDIPQITYMWPGSRAEKIDDDYTNR